jgi:uncharacterized protein involved in response to NO
MQQQEGVAGDQPENKFAGLKIAGLVSAIGVVVVAVTAIVILGYRVIPSLTRRDLVRPSTPKKPRNSTLVVPSSK